MLPLRFFASRRYSVAISALALVLFSLLGTFFLLTQYLQFSLGYSPLQAGLRIAPVAAVLLVIAPLSVLLARWIGTKWVVGAGLAVIAIALVLLSRTTVGTTYGDVAISLLLLGIGVGLGLAPCTESIMGSLPKEQAGVGSATNDTSMQIGGALGIGVLGTALDLRYQHLMVPIAFHAAVPSAVRPVILGSIGGALAVAKRAPRGWGSQLAASARHSFISGMDLGLLIGAAVVGVAAVLVLALLPNRATRQ